MLTVLANVSSIHELQAPNFKRTDSTDKVRLRVEEMAHHRENGTVPVSASSRYASDSANYMKGMQYTFAVDPRVKPIANTTATTPAPPGEGGRSMMGKMRVRPMHPPPVPAKAQVSKDGDTTMHSSNTTTATTNNNGHSVSAKDEHAMDVSDDHTEHNDMHDDSHDQGHHLSSSSSHVDNDSYIETEEGTGHHTPTPQHLLPSHHPSSLPYPPAPSSGPHAQALSNALSSNSSSKSYAPSISTNGGGMTRAPNIIRFPTIFPSDFGPASLLCALPTSTAEASFGFEESYQSFSALGSNASSSITTQGIYGPNGGPPGMGSYPSQQPNGGSGGRDPFSSSDMSAYGNNGVGVGMQNAGTGFNFGVPRPTFEFAIEDILKSEMGDGSELGLANPGNGGQWDSQMMDFGLGTASNANGISVNTGFNPWGVPPAEISSPTSATAPSTTGTSAGSNNANNGSNSANGSTSPTKRSFATMAGSASASSARGIGNGATVAYGVLTTTGQKTTNGASPTNSTQPKLESPYENSLQSTSPQSSVSDRNLNGPTTTTTTIPGAYASTGRERSASVTSAVGAGSSAGLGGSGGVGSVVPGNVGNSAPGGVKSECANCGATHTPLWRRGLNDELNCNACGLYCKLHKRARPKNLRTSHGDRAGTAWGTKAGEAELTGEPVQCHNCATMATPLWRKDDDGNTLCNACGLYLKLHGTRRPLSMKSDVIRKRSRHETEKRTSVSSIITVMTPTNGPQNSRRNSPTPPPSAGSNSSGPEPFVGPATGPNSVDGMGFSFGPDFSFTNDSDYMSGIGMGLGNDLAAFSSFGSYGIYSEPTSMNSNGLGNGNGMTSPTSPAEMQHIVETTVMANVENGGGHAAPHAKRRRMTLESSVSGSSLAHTTGGANSAHSSPTGLGQKGQGNSPPFFALDSNGNNTMTSSSSTNNNNNANNNTGSSGGHAEQNGAASPTRSTFGSSSPTQSYYSMTGVTLDFYGHPIHPPMAPLHPPSLIHPQWLDNTLNHMTPTQGSMSQSQTQSPSASRPQAHGRSRSYSSHSHSHSHSHSRSNSQHITMPLYLYDGGASSRAYEGANANTPTASGSHPTEDELYNSGFDLFGEHDENNRIHFGPTAGM